MAGKKCPNCDKEIPNWAEYCSEECKYEFETGNSGEEY